MNKFYYQRSNLLESDFNINFEELLWMDDNQTSQWIDDMRNYILSQWDNSNHKILQDITIPTNLVGYATLELF